MRNAIEKAKTSPYVVTKAFIEIVSNVEKLEGFCLMSKQNKILRFLSCEVPQLDWDIIDTEKWWSHKDWGLCNTVFWDCLQLLGIVVLLFSTFLDVHTPLYARIRASACSDKPSRRHWSRRVHALNIMSLKHTYKSPRGFGSAALDWM